MPSAALNIITISFLVFIFISILISVNLMKYIIFNWKSYLNISESMNLSKVVSKLPSTKKYKLISVLITFIT